MHDFLTNSANGKKNVLNKSCKKLRSRYLNKTRKVRKTYSSIGRETLKWRDLLEAWLIAKQHLSEVQMHLQWPRFRNKNDHSLKLQQVWLLRTPIKDFWFSAQQKEFRRQDIAPVLPRLSRDRSRLRRHLDRPPCETLGQGLSSGNLPICKRS